MKAILGLKTAYRAVLVVINLIGFSFLGLIFLGSPNVNEEALNHITEQQAEIRLILYGVVIACFFSLLSLLLSFIFRNKLLLSLQYRKKLFFCQLLVFLFAYVIIYAYLYMLK